MGKPALALSDDSHARSGQNNTCVDDPFKSPTVPASPTTPPKACVHPSYKYSLRQPGSLYSGDSDVSTPASSMDLEKAHVREEHESQRSSRRGGPTSHRDATDARSRDPEKDAAQTHGRIDSHHSFGPDFATRITYEDDEEAEADEGREMQEEKAVKILFFLSGPCVALSAVNSIWACIAVVITLLSQPIRLCAKRPTIGQQLAGLLSPTLNLQLRSIYTPLPPYANEDGSYDSLMLLAVHMLSPFLSFVMMFAAWILAVYWLSSACVGDPAGQDKRDDGKETVLGLKKWWEKWLMRGMKKE